MRRSTRGTLGITLVELMIVVVIIAILAAISVVGYRKYIGSARISEATAMLAEFAAKEQLYFLDNGLYHPLGLAESVANFHPHDPSVKWDSAREAFPVNTAANPIPAAWVALGVRPRWPQLFCTYFVSAGAAGTWACRWHPRCEALRGHPAGTLVLRASRLQFAG